MGGESQENVPSVPGFPRFSYGGGNVWGRLGVVNFGAMRYDYSYNTAGRVTEQRLHAPIGSYWRTSRWPTRGTMRAE